MGMENRYASFVLLIGVGVVMVMAVLFKLTLGFDIDSDWFWFLAGVGFLLQGIISFKARKRFDLKYKVVRRK